MRGFILVLIGLVLISAGLYGNLGAQLAALIYPTALVDTSGSTFSG